MATMSLRRSLPRLALAVGLLLLIPAVATQISTEMNWGLEDFLAAGVLLFIAGAIYLLVAQHAKSRYGRATVALVVLLVLAFVWAELAVGIFS